MSTYRLFPSTTGPTTPTTYSGSFIAGVAFTVTQPTMYFAGYYWWVCGSGQSTAAQTFALWNIGTANDQELVTTGTATSGALTAGQWNYIPLTTPIPLAENQVYVVATGLSNNFPATDYQFGSGDPYSAGITDGPLLAYSDATGSRAAPNNTTAGQGLFTTGSADPTTTFPYQISNSGNFWIDLQITDVVPPNPTYRIFPSTPNPYGLATSAVSGSYTLTVEFILSEACSVQKLWFYSGSGCAILPSRCGIWSVTSQTEVAGSDNASPSWLSAPNTAASAAAGWCYVDYSSANLTLPAGKYRAAVYSTGASAWFNYMQGYWSAGGLGSTGAGNGPVSVPTTADADSPGQGGSLEGSWGYPNSASSGNNFWVDIEVAPARSAPPSSLLMVSLP